MSLGGIILPAFEHRGNYSLFPIFTILLCVQVKGKMEGFPMLLVGNKCDEESGKREVSAKTGEALEVKIIKYLKD